MRPYTALGTNVPEMRAFAAGVLVLTSWFAAPADGQTAPEPGERTLTIYSSLPLRGHPGPQSQDVVRGMQLALDEAGSRAGGASIRYVSLDSTRRAKRRRDTNWHPRAVSRNALTAVMDKTTIAYLGEFNSGATAISLPILNDAGIMQISPSNTYVGLTRRNERGEPGRFYPSGKRTYARVVPADHTQAKAQCALSRRVGAKRIAIVHDTEAYGKGIGKRVRRCAAGFGLEVVRYVALRRSTRVATVAASVVRSGADALIFAGITSNGAPALWREVHAADGGMWLLGVEGVGEPSFTRAIPRTSRARTLITNATLAPKQYPPAARDFTRRFRKSFGKGPEPYAIYGYETMALALDAINRGGGTRAGALQALFETRNRDSVIGRYSIDRHGDTTTSLYGVLRVTPTGELRSTEPIRAVR